MRANEFINEADIPSFADWMKQQNAKQKKALKVGYRGIGQEELDHILKTKKVLPSTDLMPFDNVVVELGIVDDLGEETYEMMDQEAIDGWIQDQVPWYDGSLNSVKGGVNYTTDLDNAENYGDYVIKLNVRGPAAKFTDDYSFAKSFKNVDVVAYKKSGTDEWIAVP